MFLPLLKTHPWSVAIMLGQRLAIQATAQLTVNHEANVLELQNKFQTVLFALMISLFGVVGGADENH